MKKIPNPHLHMLASLAMFTGLICVALFTLAASPTPALAKDGAATAGDHPSQTVSRTITLKNLRAGLDKLKSYRARLAWSFDGKLADGKPYTLSYTIVESVFPADKQGYRILTGTQTPEQPDDQATWNLEMFEVAGVAYMSGTLGAETAKCEPVPMLSGLFGAGELLDLSNDSQSVRGVRLVKAGDRVNGILADQYELDAKTFLTRGIKSAAGNIWVARDGGYVVKLTLQATGDNAMLGEEAPSEDESKRSRPVEGKLTMEYVVLSVNKEKPITLPAACKPPQSAAADIPIPKSAANAFTREGMTMFQSEEKAEALIEFYKKEMPANGWKAGKTQSAAGITQMEFTKGDRKVNIFITPNPVGKGMTVIINEEK
ncbi:MAG: hypothetical protein RMN52_12410 [Anaerolineae bacterium]|nr:hypothetical protein [Candidatus Roseilinea sp.]MDW8450794.1 hypothetical protein [Anaerolineae bacterium]